MNWELSNVQAGFRKGRETKIKLPTYSGSQKKQENSRKTYTSASLIRLKPFIVWITAYWGKFPSFQEMIIPDYLACLLRSLYAGQEATVRTGHGTDWFQIRNGVRQAVYRHHAYLTYMQSTSCKMPGWMRHKLESRLLGEISITSDTQMTPLLWQKAKN